MCRPNVITWHIGGFKKTRYTYVYCFLFPWFNSRKFHNVFLNFLVRPRKSLSVPAAQHTFTPTILFKHSLECYIISKTFTKINCVCHFAHRQTMAVNLLQKNVNILLPHGTFRILQAAKLPQSSGRAKRAVQCVQTKTDGSDLLLNLLNLMNFPRDAQLGSSVARLFSRTLR